MANMGLDFRAPKQSDRKQWRKVELLYLNNVTFITAVVELVAAHNPFTTSLPFCGLAGRSQPGYDSDTPLIRRLKRLARK